jgi:uncharacterized membrane protein
MTTVTGYFDTLQDASEAITNLVIVGISRDNISLLSGNTNNAYSPYFDEHGQYISEPSASSLETSAEQNKTTTSQSTATGAGIGATLGGIGGMLVGLGLLAIPGIGPALAAGPLISSMVGAGIGGAAGGVLARAGVADEYVPYYEEGVRRGGHLILANVDDDKAQYTQNVFVRTRAVDVRERADVWQRSGWHVPDDAEDSNDVSKQF